MDRTRREPPAESPGRRPPTGPESRQSREAEALRANLKRRKEQARARKANSTFAPDPARG